jgi:plastocyanin
MIIRLDEVRRLAATLVWLCTIGAAGLTVSCFSERTTGTADRCEGTPESPCEVEIRNFAFVPATLRVRAGATVTWVNRDAVGHTSTSDPDAASARDSPLLATDATYAQPFSTRGESPYHCDPHPTMKGTIIVE